MVAKLLKKIIKKQKRVIRFRNKIQNTKSNRIVDKLFQKKKEFAPDS